MLHCAYTIYLWRGVKFTHFTRFVKNIVLILYIAIQTKNIVMSFGPYLPALKYVRVFIYIYKYVHIHIYTYPIYLFILLLRGGLVVSVYK